MQRFSVFLRRTTLIVATLMSAALTLFSAGVYLFFIDLRHLDVPALLSLAPPILSLPLFLIAALSRKWHARIMWMLALASLCGAYFAKLKRGPSDSSIAAVFHALRFPPVVFLILIAILVECSYRMWRMVQVPIVMPEDTTTT
jgi:hypothetical protein